MRARSRPQHARVDALGVETRHPLEELHRCGGALQLPVHGVEVAPRAADAGHVVRASRDLAAGHHELHSERLHLAERPSPRVAATTLGLPEREVHAAVDDAPRRGRARTPSDSVCLPAHFSWSPVAQPSKHHHTNRSANAVTKPAGNEHLDHGQRIGCCPMLDPIDAWPTNRASPAHHSEAAENRRRAYVPASRLR